MADTIPKELRALNLLVDTTLCYNQYSGGDR